jgi:hypothetical protein
MIPPPDCYWQCPKCGKKILTHSEHQGSEGKCSKCQVSLTFHPMKKTGPSEELPGKKY